MRNPAGDDAVERMLTQIEDLLKRQQGAARVPSPVDTSRETTSYQDSDTTLPPRRDPRQPEANTRPRPRMRDLLADGAPTAGADAETEAGADYDPDATQHEVPPYDPEAIVREIRELQRPPLPGETLEHGLRRAERAEAAAVPDEAPAAAARPSFQDVGATDGGAPPIASSQATPAVPDTPAPSEPLPSLPAEPDAAREQPSPEVAADQPAGASVAAQAAGASVAETPAEAPAAARPTPPPAPPSAAPIATSPAPAATGHEDKTLELEAIDDTIDRGGQPNGTHMTRRLTTRLGQMLTDADLLTEEQLQAALRKQQHTGERLGAVLINEGYVDEATLLSVLESQYGVPAVELDETELDPALVKLIPHDMARRNLIVPLAIHADSVDVAMVDPTDFVAMAHVRFAAGLRPNVFITTVQAARRAIARLYAQDEQAGLIEEPLDRRQAIKRMILDRDSMLMAADQDPRKFYQLAATIDAFVEEILRRADSAS